MSQQTKPTFNGIPVEYIPRLDQDVRTVFLPMETLDPHDYSYAGEAAVWCRYCMSQKVKAVHKAAGRRPGTAEPYKLKGE